MPITYPNSLYSLLSVWTVSSLNDNNYFSFLSIFRNKLLGDSSNYLNETLLQAYYYYYWYFKAFSFSSSSSCSNYFTLSRSSSNSWVNFYIRISPYCFSNSNKLSRFSILSYNSLFSSSLFLFCNWISL